MSEQQNLLLSLRQLLWSCTARVCGPNKVYYGTAFFVTPRLALTCAHVAKDAGQEIHLDLSDGTQVSVSLKAPIVHNDDYPDLALLELHPKHPDRPQYVLLDPKVSEPDILLSDGFTASYSGGEGASTNYEGPYRIAGYPDGSFIKLAKGQVVQGFSGAPLLNTSTGSVCGLVKSSRDENQALGGGGISALLVLDLFSQDIKYWQSAPYCRDTLWSSLRAFSKAANNGSGSTSINIADFISNWETRSEKIFGNIEARHVVSRAYQVTSPLEHYFNDFINATGWRDQLINALCSYAKVLSEDDWFSSLSVPPSNCEGSYLEVADRMSVWAQTARSSWQEMKRSLFSQITGADTDQERRIALASRVDASLGSIIRLCNSETANIGVCFLVQGPFGSGKTEFVRRRCAKLDDSNVSHNKSKVVSLYLYLDALHFTQDCLELTICDQIKAISGGFTWNTTEAINEAFSGLSLKLVIVIDGIEAIIRDEYRRNKIADFIAANTRFDCFLYLFTIQDTHLDKILPNSDFWRLHSFEHESWRHRKGQRYDLVPRMAGWIDITTLNSKKDLGFKILKSAGHEDIATILEVRGQLPSPLIAQLFITAFSTSISYIDIVI